MTTRKLARLTLIPAFVSAILMGCGGATTQDTAPTAPPLTAENTKEKVAGVNAGLGATGKGGHIASPGINAPSK